MFPVVSNASPEGYIPGDDTGTGEADGEASGDVAEAGTSSAQLILVCCWRSMKEVALTYAALFNHMPIDSADNAAGSIFTQEQAVQCGQVSHVYNYMYTIDIYCMYAAFSATALPFHVADHLHTTPCEVRCQVDDGI